MATELSDKPSSYFKVVGNELTLKMEGMEMTLGVCKYTQDPLQVHRGGREHTKVLTGGYCTLCWSVAYYEAIARIRAALEAADDRPRYEPDRPARPLVGPGSDDE